MVLILIDKLYAFPIDSLNFSILETLQKEGRRGAKAEARQASARAAVPGAIAAAR